MIIWGFYDFHVSLCVEIRRKIVVSLSFDLDTLEAIFSGCPPQSHAVMPHQRQQEIESIRFLSMEKCLFWYVPGVV